LINELYEDAYIIYIVRHARNKEYISIMLYIYIYTYIYTDMYVYILKYTDICTLYIRVLQESQVSVKFLSDKKKEFTEKKKTCKDRLDVY